MHTLRTIAEETGESKDTIRKRYSRAKAKHGELGEVIDGVRTFSDGERAILDGFAAEPRTRVDRPFQPVVEIGNHASQVENPEALSNVSLDQFRDGNIESVSFADTDDILAKIDNGLAAIEYAMESDIANREAKLSHDKANQRAIKDRVGQFKLKSMEYRIEARLTDRMQSEATQETAELIRLFQSLQEGK